MKRRDLEVILDKAGYVLQRSSGHLVYSNGTNRVTVPHAREINPFLVKKILKSIEAGCIVGLRQAA